MQQRFLLPILLLAQHVAQEYYTVVAACGIFCCKNVKIICKFLWNDDGHSDARNMLSKQ